MKDRVDRSLTFDGEEDEASYIIFVALIPRKSLRMCSDLKRESLL